MRDIRDHAKRITIKGGSGTNLTIDEAVKLLSERKIIGDLNFEGAELIYFDKVIYHQLLTLATQVSQVELKMKISQREISELTGMPIATLKRKLKLFSSLGLIEITTDPEHRFDRVKTYRFKKVEMEETE